MFYRIVRMLIRLVIRGMLAILGGLKVEGNQNLPRQGPLIVAVNHISFSDPLVISVALHRPTYFMATDLLFKNPVLGRLARFMRIYPVKQDSPDRGALRYTEKLLNQGEAVVVFPEGHVNPEEEMLPIQPGIVMVAMRSEAPVLPVGIIGTDRLVPYQKVLPRHAGQPIMVRFGKPISVEELTGGLKGREALQHGVKCLRAAIETLVKSPPNPQEVAFVEVSILPKKVIKRRLQS